MGLVLSPPFDQNHEKWTRSRVSDRKEEALEPESMSTQEKKRHLPRQWPLLSQFSCL